MFRIQIDEFITLVESDTPQDTEKASQQAHALSEELKQIKKKKTATVERSALEEAQEIARQLKAAEERKNAPAFETEIPETTWRMALKNRFRLLKF